MEQWFEEMGGTGLHERSDAYPLGHLRETATDHLFIVQAHSFLQKRTAAGTTLRLKTISKLFLAAFNEGGITTDMVKTVLSRRKKTAKNRA